MSKARLRRKLAREHLTYRNPPAHVNATEEDRWESGKGAATAARYDKRWYQRELAAQLGDVTEQAPVKYNRCKHCRYRKHCPPDLMEMRVKLADERKLRESEQQSLE